MDEKYIVEELKMQLKRAIWSGGSTPGTYRGRLGTEATIIVGPRHIEITERVGLNTIQTNETFSEETMNYLCNYVNILCGSSESNRLRKVTQVLKEIAV